MQYSFSSAHCQLARDTRNLALRSDRSLQAEDGEVISMDCGTVSQLRLIQMTQGHVAMCFHTVTTTHIMHSMSKHRCQAPLSLVDSICMYSTRFTSLSRGPSRKNSPNHQKRKNSSDDVSEETKSKVYIEVFISDILDTGNQFYE